MATNMLTLRATHDLSDLGEASWYRRRRRQIDYPQPLIDRPEPLSPQPTPTPPPVPDTSPFFVPFPQHALNPHPRDTEKPASVLPRSAPPIGSPHGTPPFCPFSLFTTNAIGCSLKLPSQPVALFPQMDARSKVTHQV